MNLLTEFLNTNKKIKGKLPFLLEELTTEFINENFTKASAKEVLDNKLIGMEYAGYKRHNNHIFINLNNEIYKYNN